MRRRLMSFCLPLALMLAPAVHAAPLDDANAAFQRGDYATAERILLPMAEAGNAYAQYRLGMVYAEATGEMRSTEEAAKWYESAALQGQLATVDSLLPDLLVFPPGTDLHDHPLVASAALVLQSKASAMPAHALRPRPGWAVVDACAAPGNKTTHLAALMGNRGAIHAFEASVWGCVAWCCAVFVDGPILCLLTHSGQHTLCMPPTLTRTPPFVPPSAEGPAAAEAPAAERGGDGQHLRHCSTGRLFGAGPRRGAAVCRGTGGAARPLVQRQRHRLLSHGLPAALGGAPTQGWVEWVGGWS